MQLIFQEGLVVDKITFKIVLGRQRSEDKLEHEINYLCLVG